MFKSLLQTLRQTRLLPRLLIVAAILLAAAYPAGRTRIRMENTDETMYILGKKSNPKAVCITNQAPINFAGNVIKR